MAARIDYSVGVSAIQEVAHEGQTVGAIDAEIGKTLVGGKSSTVWAGNAIDAWAAGVHAHVEANSNNNTAVGASGDDLIFIKHSGKRYDSSTSDNLKADGTADTTEVKVFIASTEVCRIQADECVVLPKVQGTINVGSTATTGTAPAVQYAKLT
tara:strand:- start:36 stop:497 length:462 start_codon:yes stop_codon:yes gene_type:complete